MWGHAAAQGVHVYGPGGPAEPLKECAKLFTQQTHVAVTVVAGPEAQWIGAAKMDADLVYGGAEYMLTEFDLNHPGFLAAGTRIALYDRAIGILVREGNPKHITRFADLARPGIQLLDVSGAGQVGAWEDIAGREEMIPAIERNIEVSVPNSAAAIALWQSRPALDAWVTFESWQHRVGSSTLVRLSNAERIYRGTPIAIAARSQHRADAEAKRLSCAGECAPA